MLRTQAEKLCGDCPLMAQCLSDAIVKFDYLALGLDILVLHRGADGTAMAAMLDGVEGVHWVRDEVESIREFLAGYEPRRHPDPARAEPFTRRASALKLLDLIRELGDHSFDPGELSPSHVPGTAR